MEPLKVLLVDDEVDVLRGLERSLRPHGYELYCATSAKGALEVLASVAVDVVVADQQMPGGCGLELLRTVGERYPGAGRLMLTGHAGLDLAVEAINSGILHRLLLKPSEPAELPLAIHAAHEQVARQREEQRILGLVRDTQRFYARVAAARGGDGGAPAAGAGAPVGSVTPGPGGRG